MTTNMTLQPIKMPPENTTMMLPDQYYWVSNWLRTRGAYLNHPAADAAKILEEVLELCIKCGTTEEQLGQIFAREVTKAMERRELNVMGSPAQIAEEWADVALTLAAFAVKMQINGPGAIGQKIPALDQRAWVTDRNGILIRPGRPNVLPY